MADVFISYKRENLAVVQPLVEALREAGLSVWWDQDIAPDAPWEATIEAELAAAKVAVVAWSPAAVASENVKAEARFARENGKLIQVFVAPCAPPLFFGERQGVDLSTWHGDRADYRLKTVIAAVQAVRSGKRPPQGVGYAPARRRAPWGLLTALVVGVSTALGLLANLGGARDFVCSLPALEGPCRGAGLVAQAPPPPPTAEEVRAAERAALLARIPGVWGLPGRNDEPACTVTGVYSVERRGDDDIIAFRRGDYLSEGVVVSSTALSLFTRTLTPADEAGRQYELIPEAGILTHKNSDNVATTLVRCGP